MGVAVDEVLPRYLPPPRRKTKASAPVCFVVSVFSVEMNTLLMQQ